MLTTAEKHSRFYPARAARKRNHAEHARNPKSFWFASQTSVMQYIAALERKGFLERHAGKARALITPVAKSADHRCADLRADSRGHVGAD